MYCRKEKGRSGFGFGLGKAVMAEESEMESASSSKSKSKVQLIKQSIKQLMEEESSSDHTHTLLSKLMSQLEAAEPEEAVNENGKNNMPKSQEKEEDEERILKELERVKRQNLITHCLLSVMILLTVAWQISEVSLILKLKNGFTNPFKSIGKAFKTIIKPPKPNAIAITNGNGNANEDDHTPVTSIPSDLLESNPVHDLTIPMLELPTIDFGFNPQE